MNFTASVTGAVRAELARRGLDGLALAAPLGISRNSVYSRLNGTKPFDTDELAKVADFLEVSIDRLIDSARLGMESNTVAVAS